MSGRADGPNDDDGAGGALFLFFFSFVNLFCTLLETVSIIFSFLFVLTLSDARICWVVAVTKTKHR